MPLNKEIKLVIFVSAFLPVLTNPCIDVNFRITLKYFTDHNIWVATKISKDQT